MSGMQHWSEALQEVSVVLVVLERLTSEERQRWQLRRHCPAVKLVVVVVS